MTTTTEPEQIHALLDSNVFTWALSLLGESESLEELAFGDFVTVDVQQLAEVILADRPRARNICFCSSANEARFEEREGRLMIVPKRKQFEVFRGGWCQLSTPPVRHRTAEEASLDAATRIIASAVISLNASYCRKHGIWPVSMCRKSAREIESELLKHQPEPDDP
jgi:hypothetical protein